MTTNASPALQEAPRIAVESGLTTDVELGMSHVGLGSLDERSLMLLFGQSHSQNLTCGLPHQADQIVDAAGRQLYPAYFMTHLLVPATRPIASFRLWGSIRIRSEVRRFGGTILDSSYEASAPGDTAEAPITMRASSLFILDPGRYRTRDKQVSAPARGSIRDLSVLLAAPSSVREASEVRADGFGCRFESEERGEPFHYVLEVERDVDPNHPMVFAQLPRLMEMSERQFLRVRTQRRVSDDLLQAVSLVERKTFYYGNAFSGARLALLTNGSIVENESPSMGRGLFRTHRLTMVTEVYEDTNLLAIALSRKTVAIEVQKQLLIQDAKRLFRAISRRNDGHDD